MNKFGLILVLAALLGAGADGSVRLNATSASSHTNGSAKLGNIGARARAISAAASPTPKHSPPIDHPSRLIRECPPAGDSLGRRGFLLRAQPKRLQRSLHERTNRVRPVGRRAPDDRDRLLV